MAVMTVPAQLERTHAYSRLNRQFMVPGAACRCFHCLAGFPAERITQWVDEGRTALCPVCGVDTVLSDRATAVSDALLQQLHAAYVAASRQYSEAEWRAALLAEQASAPKAVADGR